MYPKQYPQKSAPQKYFITIHWSIHWSWLSYQLPYLDWFNYQNTRGFLSHWVPPVLIQVIGVRLFHEIFTKQRYIGVPSGELTFCNGKIHHFSWENPLFRLGHFQLLFVSSPEGSRVAPERWFYKAPVRSIFLRRFWGHSTFSDELRRLSTLSSEPWRKTDGKTNCCLDGVI